MKPRLFIGSSSEGLEIAKIIEKEMADEIDCFIWTKQFEIGNSAYEDLVSQLSLYDYGLLLATCDDKTTSRGKTQSTARDNVIFEFGLFAGRLGRHRAFLFTESGLKIPSDLNGITQPRFTFNSITLIDKVFGRTESKIKTRNDNIASKCKEIKKHILSKHSIFDFGFLPSTSLAYGYYHNFVNKAISSLLDLKEIRIGNHCNYPGSCQKENPTKGSGHKLQNMKFTDVKFTILIPSSLSSNMFDKVKASRIKNNWELIKIDSGVSRPFDFYIEADKSSKGTLLLSDIPLTLNALDEAIRAYVKKSYVGVSIAEKLMEDREISTFKNVLDHLIKANPLTRDRVKTEIINL